MPRYLLSTDDWRSNGMARGWDESNEEGRAEDGVDLVGTDKDLDKKYISK